MDKILSARVDESVLSRLGNLAKQLKQSKKSILEHAILLYASQIDKEKKQDVFDYAFGAWDRSETTSTSVKKARGVFNNSMMRHSK